MTRPRSESMTPGDIETHHIWSRCVQRAMLCGFDPLTGEDFSYRRRVLRDLVRFQSQVFAVDVGNYSILGNHFHLIVRSRPDLVRDWSDEECAWRYRMAWPAYCDGAWAREPTDEHVEEVLTNPRLLTRAREYLSSISAMLARVKEPVARLFNAEMETKGHYWEARFGNRRLETPEETIGCSFYVDLNHVKAGAAELLIESDTSAIQDRILSEQLRARWAEENAAASGREMTTWAGSDLPPVDEATLVEFFHDSWLAPITMESPLTTDEQRTIDARADAASVEIVEETTVQRTTETRASRRRRTSKTRLLHKRYRARLKRRKSDLSFIDYTWEVYLQTAERLAESIVAKRSRSGKGKQRTNLQGTASSFRRDVANFLDAIASRIAKLCGGAGHHPVRAGPNKPR